MKIIKNGIDNVLFQPYYSLLKEGRLGLLTNPTGRDIRLVSTIDILNEHFNLTALFSPEHGVRGNVPAGETVERYTDPYTLKPVYSLYGSAGYGLTDEMLDEFDILVYDIADVGVRYYTYISSLFNIMQTLHGSKKQKKLVVLDRFNILGGRSVQGGILKKGYESFVGTYNIPVRYALTAGEFANMVNYEQNLSLDLTVIPCDGWLRDTMFCDTKNSWVLPSPNIPTFETALIYAGSCLFEGTNLSEGRGTASPFHIIGAPFIEGEPLAKEMNSLKIDGVLFSPSYFKPTASKHAGTECSGVYIHITDPNAIDPLEVSIQLLYKIREKYSGFSFIENPNGHNFIELLSGSSILTDKQTPEEVLEVFRKESECFIKRKEKFHIYD